MNKTISLLVGRASCRAFTGRKISSRTLNYILEAGIHSPTGGNLQPYSVIKIEKPGARSRLSKLCGQSFMKKAPLHLVFCMDFHRLRRWAKLEKAPFSADRALRPFWIAFQDTMICAQNMCTAADSLGLGSVYIGPVFDKIREIRKMCQLPKGVIPVVSLAVGYPAFFPAPREKLGPEVVVHNEVYREIPDEELLRAFEEKYKNARTEINTKDMRTLYQVCKSLEGDKFARACAGAVKARRYINRAQVYFGLHYRADRMLSDMSKQIKMLSKAGLTCFTQGKI